MFYIYKYIYDIIENKFFINVRFLCLKIRFFYQFLFFVTESMMLFDSGTIFKLSHAKTKSIPDKCKNILVKLKILIHLLC